MITENQKIEIDKKHFPNGFFYKTKNFDEQKQSQRLNEPFESLELYDARVKNLRHSNALYFFYNIKSMNEGDFITEISNQYLNYTVENTENAGLWLSLTYDLVLKGFTVSGKIEDINLIGAFIDWYNSRIKELNISVENKAVISNEEPKKELHNNIFVGNSFEVWQSMFEKFKIEKSKRTDMDFMVAVMKYNDLIHINIGYTDIENWINKIYEITFDKIKHTDPKATSNEKRLLVYNDIVAK
jgi:hypothetical protein